jgi:hypothetical protein
VFVAKQNENVSFVVFLINDFDNQRKKGNQNKGQTCGFSLSE